MFAPAAELVLPMQGWDKINTVWSGTSDTLPDRPVPGGWGRLAQLLCAVTQTSPVFRVQHLQPTWAGI